MHCFQCLSRCPEYQLIAACCILGKLPRQCFLIRREDQQFPVQSSIQKCNLLYLLYDQAKRLIEANNSVQKHIHQLFPLDQVYEFPVFCYKDRTRSCLSTIIHPAKQLSPVHSEAASMEIFLPHNHTWVRSPSLLTSHFHMSMSIDLRMHRIALLPLSFSETKPIIRISSAPPSTCSVSFVSLLPRSLLFKMLYFS